MNWIIWKNFLVLYRVFRRIPYAVKKLRKMESAWHRNSIPGCSA